MTNNDRPASGTSEPQGWAVTLPGFILDSDVGLGDAMKRLTYRMGVKPCRGCQRRAEALNRRIILRQRRST
jgi:hypothetical protein